MKKKERVIVCGNPDCQAEKRLAEPRETQETLSQAYCEHCGYVTIPKLLE